MKVSALSSNEDPAWQWILADAWQGGVERFEGQAPGVTAPSFVSVEKRQGTVGITMHPRLGVDVMASTAAGRQRFRR